MQFTGLADKNGREIYEGDVLAHKGHGAFVVEWDEYVVGWSAVDRRKPIVTGRKDIVDDGMECPLAYDNRQNDIRVIGNIYENPQLLRAT